MEELLYSKDRKVVIGVTDPHIQRITIPNHVETIGEKAFENCAQLEYVDIPQSVTRIEQFSFNNCLSLQEIDLPSSIKYIGYSAFGGCTSLITIDLPDSITNIDAFAFSGCKSLKSIILPSCLTEIKECTFDNCESLTSIRLPDELRAIGEMAFSRTSFEDIAIPEKTEIIGDRAFLGCNNLQEIYIPQNVASIGVMAFETDLLEEAKLKEITVSKDNTHYSSLDGVLYNKDKSEIVRMPPLKRIEKFTLPSSVIRIGDSAFSGCKYLQELVLSQKTREIYWGAFSYSELLSRITLPNSIEKIDDFAFEGTSIKRIEIPSNVVYMGRLIFYECNFLEEIHCKIADLSKLIIKDDGCLCPNKSCTLYVPAGTRWSYKHHPVFGKFSKIEIE